MPNPNYQLKTECQSFSKVLIVDEVGEFSTLLVDSLLTHGCQVNYFGEEIKDTFYYLSDKKNFSYLDSLKEEALNEKIDYLFYFPRENLSLLEGVMSLVKNFSARILLAVPLSFPERERIKNLIEGKEVNLRIVFFDCLFGPRIKSGILGELFVKAMAEKNIVLDEEPERKIYPLFAKELVRELARLIFSSETGGKSYFLQTKERALNDFVSLLQKNSPETKFVFSSKRKAEEYGARGLEKLEVNFDLDEKIQETIDWFGRDLSSVVPQMVHEDHRQNLPEPSKEEKTEMREQPILAVPKAEPVVQPSLPPEGEKLDFLFPDQQRGETVYSNFANTPPDKAGMRRNSFLKKVLFGVSLFFSLLFLFFALPVGILVGTGALGARRLPHIKELVGRGEFSVAVGEVARIKKLFKLSQKTILVTGPFYSLVGFGNQVELANEFFSFAENFLDALKFSLSAAEESVVLIKSFVNEEEVKWLEILGTVRGDLSFAYERASLAQSSLEKIEPGFKAFKKTDSFEQIKIFLPQIRKVFLKSENLISVLPEVVGVGGIKTYLVLLQNNMEIRPTGGFIGSYGVVRLENGKLSSFEVFDVYQADGQLKGHVEPPAKLKEYLGEATWYLRDSNWDPDFPVSARRAQWFLDKEMQVTADGVIAVNLEVAKKLLSSLGEVELPDYREKINQSNLFQKAEYYSELGTFPGSTQKKDFLGSLAKMIFEKIKQAKTGQLANLSRALFVSLEEKEMMLYFNDPRLESAVASLEWEGSIRNYQSTLRTDSVFNDYLSLVEANVGVDKANYYIQRKIDQNIVLEDQGRVQEKLTITYENQSPSENWPAGRYRNYLRLYLNKGTKLTSAFISDPANPSFWLPFDSRYFDETEEHGKTIFGFLFEVPIKSQRKLEINYELPERLDLSQRLTSFLLLAQKQSGAYPSAYDLTVSYPANFVPLRVIPSAVVGNQQLLISTKFNKDLIYQIDLAH